MLVLFFVVVGISLWVIAPWGQFPLNDDWVYTKNVVATVASGQFTVSSGQYAYAIPQVWLGVLVSDSQEEPFLNLRWIGIVSGLLSSVVTGFLCLRALELRNRLALLLTSLSVFFFFPCLQTSTTFMTDMPAFLLWLLSVWSIGSYLEKNNFVHWILAITFFTLALSERQLAFLIPVSLIAFENRNLRFGGGLRELWAGLRRCFPLIVFVIPLLGIQYWWTKVSAVKSVPLSFSPNPGVFIRFFWHLTQLGWLAIPFLFVPRISWREFSPAVQRRFKRGVALATIGFVLWEVQSLWFGKFSLPPFFQNMLSPFGVLPIVLGGFSEPIFTISFRVLLLVLGLWGAIQILKGFCLLWDDLQNKPLQQSLVCSSLAYLVFICFRHTQFDRYAIPIVPLAVLCVLKICRFEKPLQWLRRIGTALATACIVCFSTTLVADYFRWNEARWEIIRNALLSGTPKEQLWGGYEYFGWYDLLPLWEHPRELSHRVSPSKLENYEVIGAVPYRSWWGRRQKEMFLLRAGS